jgi:hypothetical protein
MSHFVIKDMLSIKGSTPYWGTLQKDVEIIGMTKLSQLADINIDYYALYFAGKNIDELYNTYKEQDIDIYMAREIIKEPYSMTTNTDAPKVAFFYFSDELLDLNNTKYLKKRSNVKLNICIGNIDTDKVTTALKAELSGKFLATCNDYTSTGYIGNYTESLIAQTKDIADAEDAEFERLKQERIDAANAIIAAEQARLDALVDRETAIALQEDALDIRDSELDNREVAIVTREDELDDRSEVIRQREDQLDTREDILNLRELELGNMTNIITTQSGVLRSAIDILHQNQTLLSLPLTQFDLTGLPS